MSGEPVIQVCSPLALFNRSQRGFPKSDTPNFSSENQGVYGIWTLDIGPVKATSEQEQKQLSRKVEGLERNHERKRVPEFVLKSLAGLVTGYSKAAVGCLF